jgi:endonuclease/exonuclease/phosphatase family metal-dependent hydrolase
MKILSWNIAGAHKFSRKISNALHHKNYDKEDLDYFLDEIKKTDADIVLLQEAHSLNDWSQGKIFAEKLSYPYIKEYVYGKSAVKAGFQMTLVTMSKYPIQFSYFHAVPNPHLTVKRPNGEDWITLDMGFLVTEILFGNVSVYVANCHLVPFHYYERSFAEPAFQQIRDDISSLLITLAKKPCIAGGDYNYEDLRSMLLQVFIDKLYEEAFEKTETAPGKGQQDHILFSNHWNLGKVEIEKRQADHYKCIVEVILANE